MKKRNLYVLLIVIIFSFVGCTSNKDKSSNINNTTNKQLTQKEKLDDFEYMYTILKENYPYFEVNKRLNAIDWVSKKDEYISQIKSTNDDNSFFLSLQDILSDFKNWHVEMLNRNGYFHVKSVYERSLTNQTTFEAWLKQLNSMKAIERYSAVKGTVNTMQPSSNHIVLNNVKTEILEKEKIAYLAIHSFNIFNIDEDMKIIRPYLQEIKNYKALIIDIRGNSGGSPSYWSENIVPRLINKPLDDIHYIALRGGNFTEQFVKSMNGVSYDRLEPISTLKETNLENLSQEIKDDFKYYFIRSIHCKPKQPIGFEGKIYLLVDGDVFSAAESFATFAKSTGFATLVGERTGGDGGGIDAAICALPNSGYCFRFSQCMVLTSDGTGNFEHKTEPDIKVSAKINSNLLSDETIQTVLKLVD